MRHHNTVFHELTKRIDWAAFDRLVGEHHGDHRVRRLRCRDQFVAMLYARLSGAQSLREFEVLHSRLIRETMVDRFQHLDADGDGRVTEDEMTAPAKKMERVQRMRGMMMPGAAGMHDEGTSENK